MQNAPENSAKTSLPWLHFKTDNALRREENKVEFLEGLFFDEKLPILHKKKAEYSFELSLSIFCLLTVYFYRDRGDHFKVVGLKNLASTKKH